MTIEFALSLVGTVAFLYVTLKVWMWLNTMIVQRQDTFQNSRLAAGRQSSPGVSVSYRPPRLQLVGLPSVAGAPTPGMGGMPSLGDPPCASAEAYFERARNFLSEAYSYNERLQELLSQIALLTGESSAAMDAAQPLIDELVDTDCTTQPARCDELQQQINELMEQAEAGGSIGRLTREIEELLETCRPTDAACQNLLQRKQEELNRLNEQLQGLQEELQRVRDRQMRLIERAREQVERGQVACDLPPEVFF